MHQSIIKNIIKSVQLPISRGVYYIKINQTGIPSLFTEVLKINILEYKGKARMKIIADKEQLIRHHNPLDTIF